MQFIAFIIELLEYLYINILQSKTWIVCLKLFLIKNINKISYIENKAPDEAPDKALDQAPDDVRDN